MLILYKELMKTYRCMFNHLFGSRTKRIRKQTEFAKIKYLSENCMQKNSSPEEFYEELQRLL
ncbi:hypothetical protein phiOC_p170 [Ochrobactrum phage vB_OspM_OC]|nr:hypothetical protein phiOC_p170 [Ochrobactrum phage vB_OspM_OC]